MIFGRIAQNSAIATAPRIFETSPAERTRSLDITPAGLARYYNSCYNRASEELQACARNTYERHARQPA